MKKIAAVLAAIILLLTLCSCKDKPGDGDGKTPVGDADNLGLGTVRLAYSRNDSLNPFEAESEVNIRLMTLIYDGLYNLDEAYEPVPCIAQNCIVEKSILNITLAPDAKFSDGTLITASDVVYSFERAKDSPAYSERMKNFESAVASSSNILVITLTHSDPYAASCLDFPIVRNIAISESTTGKDTGNKKPEDVFIGSGRYIFKEVGESKYLVVNTMRENFNPKVKTIELVPVMDRSSIEGSVEIGNTTFAFNDLSSGTYRRLSAKSVEVGINNLVYLGFNEKDDIFVYPQLRMAVNLLIDREEIVQTAFQGHARVACSPFNPDWYAMGSGENLISRDPEKAKELIDSVGINIGKRPVIILVNADNAFKVEAAEFIKDYLEEAGFGVLIKKLGYYDYVDDVRNLQYDIYIGEVKLTNNMDLDTLLNGNLSYGFEKDSATSVRYTQLLDGTCELMDLVNTFNEDLPFAALCYRNATASYTNSLTGSFSGCDCDIYSDIDTWYFGGTK